MYAKALVAGAVAALAGSASAQDVLWFEIENEVDAFANLGGVEDRDIVFSQEIGVFIADAQVGVPGQSGNFVDVSASQATDISGNTASGSGSFFVSANTDEPAELATARAQSIFAVSLFLDQASGFTLSGTLDLDTLTQGATGRSSIDFLVSDQQGGVVFQDTVSSLGGSSAFNLGGVLESGEYRFEIRTGTGVLEFDDAGDQSFEGSFSFNLNIPAPGAAVLLAGGAMAAARRRR